MGLTKKERKKRLREKYYTKSEKFFVLLFVGIVLLSLLLGIYYGIVLGWDLFLIAVLIVGLIVMLFFSSILIDAVFYEGV